MNAAPRILLVAGLLLVLNLAACAGPPEARRSPWPPTQPEPPAYGPEPTVEPSPLERAAIEAGQRALAPSGPRPISSPSLLLAARELAERAAAGDAQPLASSHMRGALARALAFDPAPAGHFAAAPPTQVVATLASTLAPGAATHLGAGVAVRGGTAYAVLLTSSRAASLHPFPRDVGLGSSVRLAGELLGLGTPRVFLTSPEGRVRELRTTGRWPFQAEIPFEGPGRYLLEVTGTSKGGPEVAALLAISCGGAPLDPPPEPDPSPDPLHDPSLIVNAINATRARQGLSPLAPSPSLDAAAGQQSAAMLAARAVAHVLPGSGDVGQRLRRERIPFRRALENVAKGPTALAAHAAVEESPAHLGNLLDPKVREIGCGIARGELSTGDPVVYLTEILVEPVEDASGARAGPRIQILDAIRRARLRVGRPPLLPDPELERMAQGAAEEMLRRGKPGAGDLAQQALERGGKVSAADAFVTASAHDATRSANLADPRFTRVGVGVVVGDHPRFGAGLLWIAVLYAD